MQLPANTVYATGYTTSALTTDPDRLPRPPPRAESRGTSPPGPVGRSHTLTSAAHGRGERPVQQPPCGDTDQRRQHGLDHPSGVCQHLLLVAFLHGGHGYRWRGHLDHEPGHRRLDRLICPPLPRRGPSDNDERGLRTCNVVAFLVVAAVRHRPGLLATSGTAWATATNSGSVHVATTNLGRPAAQALPAAPASPTSACTSPASYKTVKVSWTAVTHATAYAVYESTTTATGTYTLATSGVSGTSWTTGVLSTGNYWFEVLADIGTNWASAKSAATAERIISSSACS